MKRFVILLLLGIGLEAKVSDAQIANMFLLGFYGDENSIKREVCTQGLGGVILFKNSPIKKGAIKNFKDRASLKRLTSSLKSCGRMPLIAVDQEGGLVQRIKFNISYPAPKDVAGRGEEFAKRVYLQMAKELSSLGINLDFAPVVDLAINPNNKVIVKYKRSFGDTEDTIKYASIFIDAMHRYKIATTLKHFPGHGSSLGDTHFGFVDVTSLWREKELEPFIKLKDKADGVMVAHIYNKKLDPIFPASLSRRVVDYLLRKKLGFRKVVISDDLQMGAIAKRYSLRDRVKYSINAGVDILLFANQVSPKRVVKLDRLIEIVRELLERGEIRESSIIKANRRINQLKRELY